MKVLVVNNAVPFIRGGAEELADHLVHELNNTKGVSSELLRLPFKWRPSERLIEEILIHQSIRIENVDRIIGLKFPAYLVPHKRKSLWVLHQFRQAYDLGDVGQGLSAEGRDGFLRAAVHSADNACFAACEAIFTNSPVTQSRLRRYNGIQSQVLYPPLNDASLFSEGEAGRYIFAGGRVAPGKRQHLLIEAMAHAPNVEKLVIAGPVESATYQAKLETLIAQHDLSARVELRLGYHPRVRIAEWVNGALACAYVPYDEDSLGYVTMEANAAAKAVLTTTDAGGLLELVGPETGVVTAPAPEALGKGLARMWENSKRTRDMGRAAQATWRQRKLDWASTIATLLS